jgi:hypothetical protein
MIRQINDWLSARMPAPRGFHSAGAGQIDVVGDAPELHSGRSGKYAVVNLFQGPTHDRNAELVFQKADGRLSSTRRIRPGKPDLGLVRITEYPLR